MQICGGEHAAIIRCYQGRTTQARRRQCGMDLPVQGRQGNTSTAGGHLEMGSVSTSARVATACPAAEASCPSSAAAFQGGTTSPAAEAHCSGSATTTATLQGCATTRPTTQAHCSGSATTATFQGCTRTIRHVWHVWHGIDACYRRGAGQDAVRRRV